MDRLIDELVIRYRAIELKYEEDDGEYHSYLDNYFDEEEEKEAKAELLDWFVKRVIGR